MYQYSGAVEETAITEFCQSFCIFDSALLHPFKNYIKTITSPSLAFQAKTSYLQALLACHKYILDQYKYIILLLNIDQAKSEQVQLHTKKQRLKFIAYDILQHYSPMRMLASNIYPLPCHHNPSSEI